MFAEGEEFVATEVEKKELQLNVCSAFQKRLVDSGALQNCVQATTQGQKGLNQDALLSWEVVTTSLSMGTHIEVAWDTQTLCSKKTLPPCCSRGVCQVF